MNNETKLLYFEEALKNYHGSILILDPKTKILFANQHTADMLNTSIEKLLSMDMYEVLEQGLAESSASIEVSKTKTSVFKYIRSGTSIGMYVSSIPHFNKKGEIDFILTYSQDEKLMNSYLEEMETYKNRLEELVNLLSSRVKEKNIIIENPAMKKIFTYALQTAYSDSTVMILGESGVGKEILANYIYENSSRAHAAFIPINCAAIPSEIMESEFFGYEGGSFTGASIRGKHGIFEIADKGTLFLDELAELPLSLQTKFLRVLESGEFRRVGGKEILKTDVRIIGATNRDLASLVQQGLFREDLYYRLNVVPITIPPLRDRTEEIEPLCKYFLEKLNEKYSTLKKFSDETLKEMKQYDWPGNIRELKNVVERLYVTSYGHFLSLQEPLTKGILKDKSEYDTKQFDYNFSSNFKTSLFEASPIMIMQNTDYTLNDSMEAYEKECIKFIVEQCHGNLTLASKKMGIHRTGLYQKIKKYNLEIHRD